MSKELIKLLRAEIARTVDLDMMHHNAANRIEELEREVESLKASMYGHYELEAERDARSPTTSGYGRRLMCFAENGTHDGEKLSADRG